MEKPWENPLIILVALLALLIIGGAISTCAVEDLREANRRTFITQCSKAAYTAEECIQLWSLGREVR